MMMLEKIKTALQVLNPAFLEVTDESHMHSRGHETHYKAVIVSEAFAGLSKVRRQQAVYAALKDVMPYALAQHTYTPEEWSQAEQAPDSPNCMGGSLHDVQQG
nr:BolA family protein [Thiopseudomonas denitrificans]